MTPVKQPATGGLVISGMIVFWLVIVSIVLAFNATTVGSWLWATVPFGAAGLIIWRVERTIRRYQNYCEWLEEQHIEASIERQEMAERFEAIIAEYEDRPYDRENDF